MIYLHKYKYLRNLILRTNHLRNSKDQSDSRYRDFYNGVAYELDLVLY